MEYSHEQSQKRLSYCPVDGVEVLAYRWLGELPVYAFAVPCFISQLCWFMLGNLSESESKVIISCYQEGLGQNSLHTFGMENQNLPFLLIIGDHS